MLLILILITIVSILCLIHWFLNGRDRARIFFRIPGPPGGFLFGNALQYFDTSENIFLKMRTWSSTYKNRYRQWVYPFGVLNLYNPDDIEIVLSTPRNIEKSILYDFIRPWLRDGLLLSRGQKWQTRRKILTPAFHFNILRHFTTIMEENNWKYMKKLNGEQIDVVPVMSEITLNSLCETAMGTKLSDDSTANGKAYKNAIYEMGKLIIYRIARAWLVKEYVFNLTAASKRQKEVLNIIHSFPKSIICDRKKYIEKNGITIPCDDNLDVDGVFGPLKKKMAMLDLLITAEKDGHITDEGIEEEVDTFMFEGHDTTSMGLSFLLMEIANNQDVQETIVKELKSIFGGSVRPATMQDLTQMKYLECCIKESLRLYPPVPFISRKISETITLTDGTVIPSGDTICHVLIFDLHRRADLYEDPMNFKPERFLPENWIGKHPYSYIPFSAGPRNCIGQKFAMLEMKSVISTLLRNYGLKPITTPNQLQFTTDLVLRTTHPIYVKLFKRSI